jgi:hypothetical protein
VRERQLKEWRVEGHEGSSSASSPKCEESAKVALLRSFEFRLPLSSLLAKPVSGNHAGAVTSTPAAIAPTSRLKLRFSLWHNRLPVDALPVEGWIELQLLSEWELAAGM